MCQEIWYNILGAWAMIEREVEARKVEGPAGLSAVELVGFSEVGGVFVINKDFKVVSGTFEVVAPFFHSTNDAQKLLVMDIVILFRWWHGQEKEHAGISLFITPTLR